MEPTERARPAPRGTAAYQRRRAVKACQVCRARRTKCDNLKPLCSFCLKTGAKCIQSPVDFSSFDPASLKILERLDDLEQLVRGQNAQDAIAEDFNSLDPLHVGMVLPMSVDELLAKLVSQRRLPPAEMASPRLTAYASPGSFDLEEPSRVRPLLDRFFEYVHVKNPILDETHTRHVVQTTVVNGIDWSAESCLSLLILALGSIATPFGASLDARPGSTEYAQARSYFCAAEKRLGMLLTNDQVIAPQCLFLAGVFLMCTFQPHKAWRCFVQSLACCQQFPFLTPESQRQYHDEVARDHDPAVDLQQAIYWSAWKSEREVRGYLHLQDFSEQHSMTNLYPSFFPTPPSVRAISADTTHQREEMSWYFYLSEISLRRLSSRIAAEMIELQQKHKSRGSFLTTMADLVPSFEEQTLDWIRSLPASLSFDAPIGQDDVCRFVLRGHVVNVYEMIYWPFVTALLDSSSHESPRNESFALLANKGIENHAFRLRVNKQGFYHRHHGTYYMMASCARSALVLAAYRSTPGSGPLGSGVEEVVGLLEYWSDETHDFERVRVHLQQHLEYLQE